ncbi:unnamed protein product [Phytophthora fragariaefolia]|uniref:Unnamed protein product n=1 Tax=Phytophthora fragariaefolia TaxID=1490495 RepID=A0A9W6U8U8_9STRA|nr:unnamed protein product [Phytophthora fragariaefolia]
MPLTCATSIGRTSALSTSDQRQKELLVSFLVENNAQATWRKIPRQTVAPASLAVNDSGSLGPTNENTTTSALKRPILSFSASFGIHCTIDESADSQQGIMFDTSDISSK